MEEETPKSDGIQVKHKLEMKSPAVLADFEFKTQTYEKGGICQQRFNF